MIGEDHVIEVYYHCTAEWHLYKSKSKLAVPLYYLALKLGKNTGLFSGSLQRVADYFQVSYKTAWTAAHVLEEKGFFDVKSEEEGKPTVYQIIRHKDWALAHPSKCAEKISFPWSNEKKDQLGVDLYAASGQRVNLYPNQLLALRNTGHTDEQILSRWKAFLIADDSHRRQWRGAIFRFIQLLKQTPVSR